MRRWGGGKQGAAWGGSACTNCADGTVHSRTNLGRRACVLTAVRGRARGTQFTRFTSAKVQILTAEELSEVSEYTDKIDAVRAWGWNNSKVDRIREEIGDLLQLLLGLVVAGNYSEGAKVVSAGDGQKNAEFFQKVLEIGRRYKITNPEKMRCTYGKLIYLMQVKLYLMQVYLMHLPDAGLPDGKPCLLVNLHQVNQKDTVDVWQADLPDAGMLAYADVC